MASPCRLIIAQNAAIVAVLMCELSVKNRNEDAKAREEGAVLGFSTLVIC